MGDSWEWYKDLNVNALMLCLVGRMDVALLAAGQFMVRFVLPEELFAIQGASLDNMYDSVDVLGMIADEFTPGDIAQMTVNWFSMVPATTALFCSLLCSA